MADPLFLDQTEARRPNKILLETAAPLYLRVWMIAPPFNPLFQGVDPALEVLCTLRF